MRRTFGAYALIITGFLACLCHLPLVLPLALTLLAGTAMGGWLANHIRLIYSLSAAYFVVALLAGLWLSGRQRANVACRRPGTAACTPSKSSLATQKEFE